MDIVDGVGFQIRVIGEKIKKNPDLIKHEVLDGRAVLTASTEQLQQFMKTHANDEGLFGDPGELQRVIDANDPNDD